MRARVITIRNRASSKNNAACTSTDDLIVKSHVDACTSTDDLIVKNHVDACTSTDDICTNKNKPSTNKPSTNKPSINENEPCTNKNEASINENDNDSEADDDDDDDGDSEVDDNDSEADDSVNKDFPNLIILNNLIIVGNIRKDILNNNSEIKALISEAENMPRDDFLLKLDQYKKLNKLLDNLLNYIWKMVYGENKVNNKINSIDIK